MRIMSWKSLHLNPPTEDCNICVRVGDNYETYWFKKYTDSSFVLVKFPKEISPREIPQDAMYVNLDNIL